MVNVCTKKKGVSKGRKKRRAINGREVGNNVRKRGRTKTQR